MKLRVKKTNSLRWLYEPLERRSDFIPKKMFGCEAAYFGDRLMLVLADSSEEPWNGLLLPTHRDHHPSLQTDYPELRSHKVLGKWLYISQADPGFEETATSIVKRAMSNDPRFGVDPKPKKNVKKPSAPSGRAQHVSHSKKSRR